MSKKLEIILISVFVFIFPFMKIKFGSLPIYFIDLFYVFLIIKYGFQKRIFIDHKFIFLYLLFSFFSFLVEFTSHYSILSIYFLLRYTLPFYGFFYIFKNINTQNDISFLLKTIFITAFVNSSFVILYSFNFTRPFLSFLYKNEFFHPQKERFSSEFLSEVSERGVTLAGGANSTSFLCLIGIAVFYFFKSKNNTSNSFFLKNEIIGWFLFLFFSFASISSISRSAITTLFFIILFYFKNKVARLSVFAFLILSLTIFQRSNLFKFIDYSRLTQSYEMVLGEESFGYSEEERISAYTKPIEFLIQHPLMFLIGKGLSNHKVDISYSNGYYTNKIQGRHGLLGAISFDRGFIAFFFFLIFILKLYYTSFFKSKSTYKSFNNAVLLTLLMPLLVTHIFIDQVYGVYQFAFLSALVISLDKKSFFKTN